MSSTALQLQQLLQEVRNCTMCAASLPLGANPVLQASRNARVLIAGQAPGKRVHLSGIPFDDASGDRLRTWLGVDRLAFYDARAFAILPMGFCYPGTGKSGDLPPRSECAPAWRAQLLAQLPCVDITLVIGQYAMAYHMPSNWPRSRRRCSPATSPRARSSCCPIQVRAITSGSAGIAGLRPSSCRCCRLELPSQ